MRLRVRSGLLVAAMVTALALTAGCGDNDNNDNDGAPRPTRTATPGAGPTQTPGPQPTATPPPGGEQAQVAFAANATADLQAFQISVAYPTATGSFTGSADEVACESDGGGIFTRNDQDNGTLVLSVADTSNLSFPITISCTFDVAAGQSLAAGDLVVTVVEVTSGGAVGDPNTLSVDVSVS